MSGHLEPGDAEKIEEIRLWERTEAMEEKRRQDALDVWKFACPTCFADPGERCITRNGKRAMRHKGRAN